MVCPLLIDTELDPKIPIDMFQAKQFDKNGIKQLCRFLAEKTNLETTQVDLNFKAVWTTIEMQVQKEFEILKASSFYGIKILKPEPNAMVTSPIKISGTYKTKPPANSIRILECNPVSGQYWPKETLIFDESNNTWEGKVNTGAASGKKVELIVAEIGKNGEALFQYRKKVFEATNKSFGIDSLTSDIIFCDKVKIIIQ